MPPGLICPNCHLPAEGHRPCGSFARKPPFAEDTLVCEWAEAAGLVVSRYESVEITDEAAIKAAGLVKQTLDYQRIRKLLESGAEVPGAKLAGVEYRLRRNP